MTSRKQLRAEIDEKNAEKVKSFLEKETEPMLANQIAAAVGLDSFAVSAALARLRNRRQAKNKGETRVGMLWVTDRPDSPAKYARGYHYPGTQPTGTTDYWIAHMAAMNREPRA